jgi:urease accessory protein
VISGVDHVLAMVSVERFAAQLGGRAYWHLPTSFVSLMATGLIFGWTTAERPPWCF